MGTCDPAWPQSVHFVVVACVTQHPPCRYRRIPNLAVDLLGPVPCVRLAPLHSFHLVFSRCLRRTPTAGGLVRPGPGRYAQVQKAPDEFEMGMSKRPQWKCRATRGPVVAQGPVAPSGSTSRVDTSSLLGMVNSHWMLQSALLSRHDPSGARHLPFKLAGTTAGPMLSAGPEGSAWAAGASGNPWSVSHCTVRAGAVQSSARSAGRSGPGSALPAYEVRCRRKTRALRACSIRSMRLVPTLSARSRFPIHSPPGASRATTCMIAHMPRLAAISSTK